MIVFNCLSCKQPLSVPDVQVGTQVRCPKCGAATTVPGVERAMAAQMETKRCPFCGEEIAAVAVKCRYCNEFLDGGAHGGRLAFWVGDQLVVPPNGAISSSRCVLCGGTHDVGFKQKDFNWVPPWCYLFLLVGLLPGAIICTIMQKKSSVALPICPTCRSAWTTATAVAWLFGIFGIVGCPWAGVYIGMQIDSRDGGPFGGIAGFFAWLVGIVLLQVLWGARTQVSCKRIDDQGTWLKLPNPAAVQSSASMPR